VGLKPVSGPAARRIDFCRLLPPLCGKAADGTLIPPSKGQEVLLPALVVGDYPAAKQGRLPSAPDSLQARYSEAALVQMLEKEGKMARPFHLYGQHHRAPSLIAVYATGSRTTRSPRLHRFLR